MVAAPVAETRVAVCGDKHSPTACAGATVTSVPTRASRVPRGLWGPPLPLPFEVASLRPERRGALRGTQRTDAVTVEEGAAGPRPVLLVGQGRKRRLGEPLPVSCQAVRGADVSLPFRRLWKEPWEAVFHRRWQPRPVQGDPHPENSTRSPGLGPTPAGQGFPSAVLSTGSRSGVSEESSVRSPRTSLSRSPPAARVPEKEGTASPEGSEQVPWGCDTV